jgi:hypothetical protein
MNEEQSNNVSSFSFRNGRHNTYITTCRNEWITKQNVAFFSFRDERDYHSVAINDNKKRTKLHAIIFSQFSLGNVTIL